jgi:acyl-CoA synthetase (AMP-forming)/AMP-acid ligase II
LNIPNDRPWFKYWPEGIPRRIEYPEIPLNQFLVDSAWRYPDKPAFCSGEDSITFSELDDRTSRLAAALSGFGLNRGGRGIVFLPNGIEYVTGYYGILKAGGSVAPVNPTYKKDELRHVITDSNAVAVICNQESGHSHRQ